MYKEIYVPVDNSDYSNQACVIGVDVARQFGGRVAGCHAYAAKMHDVKAPLVEAALTKAEIRELSHRAGLSVWDRPAAACLSSRVPYGTPVNVKTIKTIEEGEEAIKALGFRQFRVRFHGDLVRIEIARDELQSAMSSEMFARFAEIFKSLGFHFITLDVEGYRQGALNAALAE